MPIYRMAFDASVCASFEADDEASARAQAEAFRLEWIDGLDVDIWCDDDATDPDVRVYFDETKPIELEDVEGSEEDDDEENE
jgi:hypothetical protein